MIKIAVVDDDEIYLKRIRDEIVNRFEYKSTVETFLNSVSFFQTISNQVFDVVFLDIDMPDMNGFELAQSLRSIKSRTLVYFVSSYEHLVFECFEFRPLAFIRKKSLGEDIQKALDILSENIDVQNETFFFYTYQCDLAVRIHEILFFESIGHELYLITSDNKYKLKKEKNEMQSLSSIERKFKEFGFIRIHKSFFVNFRQILQIKRNSVILKNGFIIKINPHNVSDIKYIYQQLLMNGGRM